MNSIPRCNICGTDFDNIFDAVNHLVEDGGETLFNPKVTLSGGYSLLIGSLLRELFDNANDPEAIKRITQMTYATLYASKTDDGEMKRLVNEAIVHEHMAHVDDELVELLGKEDDK